MTDGGVRVDLREFLDAYLAEVDEHLATANDRLLAVEAATKGGGSDPRAVRDALRALHTIKGLSAMVGVEGIVTIAHHAENVLRGVDQGGGKMAPAALEALFDAMRAIRERLASVGQGGEAAAAPADLVAALDGLANAAEPSGGGKPLARSLDLDPAVAAKLAPFERAQLLDAPALGKRAVRVDFTPSSARANEGLTITAVRERVGALGDIVKVVPLAVAESAAAPGGLRFAMLIVTSADDASLAAAAACDPAEVKTLAAAAGGEGADEAEPLPAEIDEPTIAERSLRVDAARVDDALEALSNVLVTRARLARAAAALRAAGAPTRDLDDVLDQSSRQLRDLRAAILRLRMIPVAGLLGRLPLVTRGLRRGTGKQVRLVTDGGGAEVDKTVAERLFPALVHLLRNAIDHGIESPEERAQAGKPAEGIIEVTCTMHTNRQLSIRVADDGRGIDRVAVERAAGAALPNAEALLHAIARPGLSTRREATTTSGRGFGMDIAWKVVVDQLGGEMTLESEPGRGTAFTLRVPLTVAILDAFTIECGDDTFAVPVSTVEQIIEIDPSRITRAPGVALVQHRGEALPLVALAEALGRGEGTSRHALVVRRGRGLVAFGLDRVTGQREAVVRPLTDPLVQVPGVAGATDFGDGRATLVLDLPALAAVYADRRAPALLSPAGTGRSTPS